MRWYPAIKTIPTAWILSKADRIFEQDGSLSHGESPNPAKGHGKNRDQSNAPQRDAKRRRENVESVPPASRRRGRVEETPKTEDLSQGRAARGRQEGVRALFSGYVPEKQDMKRFQGLNTYLYT